MNAWNALSTEAQERIIGRTKLSDIELDDSVKPTSAHNALTTIVEDGKEIKILRDNMPFGRPAHGEFGTYFISYSRSPPHYRTDAREHVHRAPSRQLRPAAGLQPRRDRKLVLCAVGDISGERDRRPKPASGCGIPCGACGCQTFCIHPIGARGFAPHRISQRRRTP
jgi:hypothetical protein